MLWNRHTVYCRGPFAANEPAGPTDKAVPGKRSCRTLSTGGKLKNRMLRDACLTVGILIDAADATVRQYASFMQAYRLESYTKMLSSAALPLQRILSENVWTSGQDFYNKLQTFICRKI